MFQLIPHKKGSSKIKSWIQYFLRHHIQRLHCCRSINASVFYAKLHLAVLVHNFCVLVLLQHRAAPLHDVALCTENAWLIWVDYGQHDAAAALQFLTWFFALTAPCTTTTTTTTRSVQNYLLLRHQTINSAHLYMYSHTLNNIQHHSALLCWLQKMHPDFKDPSVFGTLLIIVFLISFFSFTVK